MHKLTYTSYLRAFLCYLKKTLSSIKTIQVKNRTDITKLHQGHNSEFLAYYIIKQMNVVVSQCNIEELPFILSCMLASKMSKKSVQ